MQTCWYNFLHADVNECTGVHGCDHHCNNTNGSYHCTCDVGFQLGNDDHSCYGIIVHARSYLNYNYVLSLTHS